MYQGTHCKGKTGEMAKQNLCQGKHREFGNVAKTQGIWFAQVVNSLIIKVKGVSIIAVKIPKIIFLGWISLPSQFCVCHSHKSCKLAQGKFAVRQVIHRENTGEFEN